MILNADRTVTFTVEEILGMLDEAGVRGSNRQDFEAVLEDRLDSKAARSTLDG